MSDLVSWSTIKFYKIWKGSRLPISAIEGLRQNLKSCDTKSLLKPYPAELMDAHDVSRIVNSAKYDGPECIQPVSDDKLLGSSLNFTDYFLDAHSR